MNYQKHYDLLIEKAKNRTITGYVERHHIIPKCIGGTNKKENLVNLTPEEHYIAHLLLAKIYSKIPPIINAAVMMASRNNKYYGWLMAKYAKITSDRFKGVSKSAEQRQKQSDAKKKIIEYKGNTYKGFDELKEQTKVSYYLYQKYYKKGIDPESYIDNNTYAIIEYVRNTPPRSSASKKWYNNGYLEKYSDKDIEGWNLGRLPIKRDNKGRYTRITK
jgi:hypothetical protein